MVKHRVILRGYCAALNDRVAPPLLIKRAEAEFVPAVLEGLRQGKDASGLGRHVAADYRHDGTDRLHLLQPVHRTFNLAVLELVCDRPGHPPVNARSIESAGLVVRRVGRIPEAEPTPLKKRKRFEVELDKRPLAPASLDEGWFHANDQPFGWKAIQLPDLDPDPARRPVVFTANRHVNGRLAAWAARLDYAERVAPLFVAPPDVCAAAGRTVLYGVVPVTSSEVASGAYAAGELPEVTDADVLASMPGFLRALGGSGRPDYDGAITIAATNEALSQGPEHKLHQFVQDLRLMQFGWRAFDADGAEILNALNAITVRLPGKSGRDPLGNYLRGLCEFALLRAHSEIASVQLPEDWPQPIATQATTIHAAVRRRLETRLQEIVTPAKRFDDERALYVARAFVRLRCEDGCPPVLHWSAPSERFSIAPWWENGGPVHTIALPDIDPANVKQLKPNVAFAVPPKLTNLLNKMQPANFLKGTQTDMGNLSVPQLGWICSFSIPIITICAFIVLNIFLHLLHIVFQWLFFIKICLPFPKPPPPPQPSGP